MEDLKTIEVEKTEEINETEKPSITSNVKGFFKKNGKKIALAVVSAVGLGAAYALGVKKGSGEFDDESLIDASFKESDDEPAED